MLRQTIIEKLKELYLMITSNDNAETFTENSDLRTDLGLSSVGMLYFVIAIEQTFDITFDGASMSDFAIVKDVVDYIEKGTK